MFCQSNIVRFLLYTVCYKIMKVLHDQNHRIVLNKIFIFIMIFSPLDYVYTCCYLCYALPTLSFVHNHKGVVTVVIVR